MRVERESVDSSRWLGVCLWRNVASCHTVDAKHGRVRAGSDASSCSSQTAPRTCIVPPPGAVGAGVDATGAGDVSTTTSEMFPNTPSTSISETQSTRQAPESPPPLGQILLGRRTSIIDSIATIWPCSVGMASLAHRFLLVALLFIQHG